MDRVKVYLKPLPGKRRQGLFTIESLEAGSFLGSFCGKFRRASECSEVAVGPTTPSLFCCRCHFAVESCDETVLDFKNPSAVSRFPLLRSLADGSGASLCSRFGGENNRTSGSTQQQTSVSTPATLERIFGGHPLCIRAFSLVPVLVPSVVVHLPCPLPPFPLDAAPASLTSLHFDSAFVFASRLCASPPTTGWKLDSATGLPSCSVSYCVLILDGAQVYPTVVLPQR